MHEPEPIAETPSVSRPRMNVIEDEPAPAPPVREGLPPGFRMRADAHYVDQLDARMSSIPVRLIDTQANDRRSAGGVAWKSVRHCLADTRWGFRAHQTEAARKIAQAHGGDLEVSAIDRGTAFLLTIPTAT